MISDGGRVAWDGDMLDITAPAVGVQVQVRADGSVVWVHVDGRTVLRVCRIPGGAVEIVDERPPQP